MRTSGWRGRRCRRRHRYRRVSPGISMVVVTRSTVERRDTTLVMQGPISNTSEEPFSPCRRIQQNCPCHGCSPTKQSYLDFVFPSVLERFRRHFLPVAAGCDVCCMLCSSDGRVRSPVRRPDKRSTVNALVVQACKFIPVVGRFAVERRLRRVSWGCCCVGGGHTHIHTAAVVKRSAGLDCDRPLDSVVMPGSASIMPQTTA